MAVQKSKVSRSKRGMRNAENTPYQPVTRVDETTGVTHTSHHMAGDYYRGKRVYKNFHDIEQSLAAEPSSLGDESAVE
ncbi:MAG: 50S ribosomal protein L32 [Legionellales bacterium]|nr:50S ribosomal protein L32 [Legionellales bacterium]|tara:strand:+ start:222 stop:455 length:234 start_codon:yes stop_codon:yes gene_type:complete